MPQTTIPTDIGTVTLSMSNAEHVYLNCENALVNRVQYHCSIHFYLIDGGWKTRNYQDLYMSRHGSFESPTSAARKKAQSVLEAAWAEFVSSDDFAPTALAASKKSLQDGINRLDENIEELETNLANARRDKAALEAKLKAL